MTRHVTLVKWNTADGVGAAIFEELVKLGYKTNSILPGEDIPDKTEILLSFAPWGRLHGIIKQLTDIPAKKRPRYIHWNLENLPDLRIPSSLAYFVAALRSWLDRLLGHPSSSVRSIAAAFPFSLIQARLHKFRYLGEYHHAYRQGVLNVLADTSYIYAQYHAILGVPAVYVPYGTTPLWYKSLDLKRDIDVLWIGTRRSRRRSNLIDRFQQQLDAAGVKFHIVDNKINPAVFDHERTMLFNRAKITLNLLPNWYDQCLTSRFHLAAGNRSMVISEKVLPHCPELIPGEYYISAPLQNVFSKIMLYLENDESRWKTAEQAFNLVTKELTLRNSVRILMKTFKDYE